MSGDKPFPEGGGLPVEIWEKIIVNLKDADDATLLGCRSTCKSFRTAVDQRTSLWDRRTVTRAFSDQRLDVMIIMTQCQVWSLSSFEVSRQLLRNVLNLVLSVSLLMTFSTAFTNKGLFELTWRPPLTKPVLLLFVETTTDQVVFK